MRWGWWLLPAICAAVLFLGALHHLSLGAPSYDNRLPWEISDAPLYRQNTEKSSTYFTPVPLAVDTDSTNSKGFFAAKPKGVFRIFCVGQSTTEGFPFQPRGGYPEWLSVRLKDLVGPARVEVINAGASGADSSRDLAIVREIERFRPDLLVLYEGNNEEFYPQIRLAQSWLGDGVGRPIIALARHSRSFRFVLAHLPYSRSKLLALYRRNVESMLALASRRSTRVILLGQVNEAVLRHRDGASLYNRFLSGLESANVAYIDLPSIFVRRCRSEAQIMPDCLVDGVHPSLEGQDLIALSIARELSRRGWGAPSREWEWSAARPRKTYERRLGLTSEFLAKAYVWEAWHIDGNEPEYAQEADLLLRRAFKLDIGTFARTMYDQPLASHMPAPFQESVKALLGNIPN